MHHKEIKRIVSDQLKKNFPNWNKLGRKAKKEISRKVLNEATADYDFTGEIKTSKEQLLAIDDQIPTKGIITLNQMADMIEKINNSCLVQFVDRNRSGKYITDPELLFVDKLLDNRVLNRLLSYEGYSPAMRDLFPSNLFRAELLKVIKYPEISYRKFCTDEYLGLERKQNRVFCQLPLHRRDMIDHTQLCKFRNSLTFTQQINLLVYFILHFQQSGLLGDSKLHAVDSTELANDCKLPLATLDINGQKIRIYSDIDADCGRRRNKRDKSVYVIGYRLHTLTVIDAQSGQSFPLVSILAPANHHDSHFLPFLVKLAQAMGIDIQLITADEAYHDNDGSLFRETGVIVSTPPSSKIVLPEHVDANNGAVYCHTNCHTPMCYLGAEEQFHEYKCGAESGACKLAETCSQSRFIPLDTGMFQQIPFHSAHLDKVLEIRKNCERPFNLLKNQTGLETVRVRNKPATMVRCTISTIAVLLIKMAGFRKKKMSVPNIHQLSLFEVKQAA